MNNKTNKNSFGYPSNEPCIVCNQFKNNQLEPRFLYTVCEDHQNVSPINLEKVRGNSMRNSKEYKIQGVVIEEGEHWYIKNGEHYLFASDLLTGIDSILVDNGDDVISGGEEIEIIIKIKGR